MNETKQTKVYLEVLRIVACFFVIVNHTNSAIFLQETPGTFLWSISLLYFWLCKVAVPIYVMISGCLLLKRIDDYKKHSLRIVRILVVLLLFSVFYYVKDGLAAGKTLSIKSFFVTIYNTPATNALWYLYLYIGVLLFLPLFQRMAVNMKKTDYVYMLVLTLGFFGIVPMIQHIFPIFSYYNHLTDAFIPAWVGIFFFGRFVDEYLELTGRRALIALGTIGVMIAAMYVLTCYEYRYSPDNYMFFDECTFFPIVLASGGIFYVVKYIYMRMQENKKRDYVITTIGGATFGIYLLSDCIIVAEHPIRDVLMQNMYPMVAVIIYEVIVFISCLLVVLIMKKIPGIRRLI